MTWQTYYEHWTEKGKYFYVQDIEQLTGIKKFFLSQSANASSIVCLIFEVCFNKKSKKVTEKMFITFRIFDVDC